VRFGMEPPAKRLTPEITSGGREGLQNGGAIVLPRDNVSECISLGTLSGGC